MTRIYTLKVSRAVSILTLLTVIIVTTVILRLTVITFYCTANIGRKVTYRSKWILIA